MVESDCSETEEGDMDRLQLSSDSVDTILPKKRLRVEDSEDDIDLPTKKHQSLFSEHSKILQSDNSETISDKNDTNACNVKEEGAILCPEKEQNIQEIFLSNSNMGKKNKDKQDIKQENGNEIPLNDNNVLNKNSGEISIKKEIVEEEDNPCKKSPTNKSVVSTPENNQVGTENNEVFKQEIDQEKSIAKKETGMKEQARTNQETKKCTVDTEVVDGLELSVECASDKEESSSDSEKEKEAKPRPKTVIIKAEPNESELDCSSEGVKSDSQRVTDTLRIKSEKSRVKRRSSRTSFSKLKASDSEDSQNSNSDEDYSPRTKKKMKKSQTIKRSANEHRLVESKRGRGKSTRYSPKKNTNDHISDEDMHTVTKKAVETTKAKNEMEEELSERESLSKSSSDNNSEKEERSMKGRKRRHSNAKPQDKHIQKLKKYLSVAGVKIKSYNDVWANCKSNAAKIKRLKQLLEENGITGRPTLEKCKRVRKKNEKMKEVSELDTANIISEGRITRARRNTENVKKAPPDTPLRHREARNTFKRIQTVVDIDSDSE